MKGGVSLLFYRCVFDEAITEKEHEMIMKLGAIGQLENDIFDVYKDYKAGVKTLATTTHLIEILRKTYSSLLQDVVRLVHQTAYTKRNKTKFLRFIAMVTSKGFVSLDQLEKNQQKTNGVFSLDQYDRKDLICDMEKPANELKSLHYFAKTYVSQHQNLV